MGTLDYSYRISYCLLSIYRFINRVIASGKAGHKVEQLSECIAMIGQGEGSAGYAIYLDSDFIGASSLNLGYADWINSYTAHFVTTILCQEYDKYSFGRSWTGDRLKNTIIKLPVDSKGKPDWKFMEDYIKSLSYVDGLNNWI